MKYSTSFFLALLLIVNASVAVSANENNINNTNMDTVNLGKTLVVYYSLGGNTRVTAEIISKMTSGILYEIETAESYYCDASGSPLDAYTLADLLEKHKKEGVTPKLKGMINNLEEYDTIIIGGPVWMPVAPPVIAFLLEHDLSGKVIAPFITYYGNARTYFKELKKAISKDANILVEGKFKEGEVGKEDKILDWLKRIEHQKAKLQRRNNKL